MILRTLTLQHFRNYKKSSFEFSPQKTVIVGNNAAGKTNLIESLSLLATGKSFRSEKDHQLIQFGETVCRIGGVIAGDDGEDNLEVVVSDLPGQTLRKRYLINDIGKRRVDFAGNLTVVLFTPTDIDLVSGQPGTRRKFLDEVLEQVDFGYRVAHTTYTKALRQRNALLEQAQQTGIRNEKLFSYWDNLLVTHGQTIMEKREGLIGFINRQAKELFPFTLVYDKSEISEERLAKYKHAEVGAGVTLVGPQRDDLLIQAYHPVSKELEEVKYFSSRGQQRLVVFELKLAQIAYLKHKTENKPLLLLDDIFSELDSINIQHVLKIIHDNQTIITTTHKEFVADMGENVIELGK